MVEIEATPSHLEFSFTYLECFDFKVQLIQKAKNLCELLILQVSDTNRKLNSKLDRLLFSNHTVVFAINMSLFPTKSCRSG